MASASAPNHPLNTASNRSCTRELAMLSALVNRASGSTRRNASSTSEPILSARRSALTLTATVGGGTGRCATGRNTVGAVVTRMVK